MKTLLKILKWLISLIVLLALAYYMFYVLLLFLGGLLLWFVGHTLQD